MRVLLLVLLCSATALAQEKPPVTNELLDLKAKIAALEKQLASQPKPTPEQQIALVRSQLTVAHKQLAESLGNPCPKGDRRLITVAVGSGQVTVGCLR